MSLNASRTRALVWASCGMVSLLTSCARDAAPIDVTALHDAPAGSAVHPLAVGARLEVKRFPGDAEGWLRAKTADGRSGWVDQRLVTRTPVASSVRYVVVPSTVALGGADGTTGVERFPVGAQMQIADAPEANELAKGDARKGRLLALKGGVPVGWVSAADVDTKPPTADALFSRALDELRAIRLGLVEENAAAALLLDKGHKGAAEVLGQLLASTDWERSKELMKIRGALEPWPDVDTTGDPGPGDTMYVVASRLKLRAKKDLSSRTRGEVGIGTPVRIEERDGEWARVTTHGATLTLALGSFKELAAFDTPPPPESTGAQRPLEGWVRVRFLADRAPGVADLEQSAATAAAQGKKAEATLYAQRALELEPTRARQVSFVEAAIASGHLAAAVDGARKATPSTRAPPAELEAFVACRGDVTKAELLASYFFGGTFEGVAPDACVASLDIHPPCDFVPRSLDDGYGYDGIHDGAATEDAGPEEPQSPEDAEAERLKEEAEQAELDAENARGAAEQAAEVAAHAAKVRALEESFPKGPHLRIRIERASSLLADHKPFLVRMPAIWDGGCEAWTAPDRAAAQVTALPLPSPLTAATVEAWVSIEDTGDAYYVLVFAADAAGAESQAKAMMYPGEPPLEDGNAPAVTDLPHVLLPMDGCDQPECGC